MAVPTNTLQTYQTIGTREDLGDVIHNISPFETPLQNNIGKTKATNVYHEWQTDSLAAASTSNAAVEGDDAAVVASNPTVRVGNRTQILTKTVSVSGTGEATDKAGRKSQMAYEVMKRGREMKRDAEAILLNNQASVAGSATVARKLGGLPAWLTSNVSRATDGVSGGFSSTTGLVVAATDTTGTGRTFAEALLKTVMQTGKTNGANFKVLSLNVFNKGQFSNATNFPGIATLRTNVPQNGGMATVVGAADVYLGDFGTLQVVCNIFQREKDAILFDPEYLAVAELRGLKQWDLAKSGDSDKKQMLRELTLEVKNEAACAIVADLKVA